MWRLKGVLTKESILVRIDAVTQPAPKDLRDPPGALQPMEFTMSKREPAPVADILDLFLTAANGLFPGAVLEALIGRLEAGK
jgi:hypothetical protein